MSLERRRLLSGLAAAAILPGLARAQAPAPAGPAAPPAPHRFRLGEMTVTVLNDGGPLAFPPAELFPDAPAGGAARNLAAAGLPTDAARMRINVVALERAGRLVLIDTGFGRSMGEAAPGTGLLPASLRAAGLDPAAVEMVLLTHLHSDHCWGLVDADGAPVFPRAQLAVTEADRRFWTDEGNRAALGPFGTMIDGARRNLAPYRDRMVMLRDGQEALPGVTPLFTPGHTVGHTSFALASGADSAIVLGDVVHSPAIQLPNPEWRLAFDSDAAQGAATRARMLDRLAADGTTALGYHFAWPGIGRVARAGTGYAWRAETA